MSPRTRRPTGGSRPRLQTPGAAFVLAILVFPSALGVGVATVLPSSPAVGSAMKAGASVGALALAAAQSSLEHGYGPAPRRGKSLAVRPLSRVAFQTGTGLAVETRGAPSSPRP